MKRQKWVYVSPWLLAAASALLTIIIGVFAVNNYQREKNLMLEALVRQGETVLRFVKVSTRSSFRGDTMNIRVNLWRWTDHMQQAMNKVMAQPDLLFIGLVDEGGNIVAGSDRKQLRKSVSPETLLFISDIFSSKRKGTSFRIDDSEEREHGVFQVASFYVPFADQPLLPKMKQNSWSGGTPFFERKSLSRDEERFLRTIEQVKNNAYVLIAEIDLYDFKTAIRRQLLQILFLSLTLLLVGFGGWLSLMTLQGFKGTQVRLQYERKFNDLLISSLPVGLIATREDQQIHMYNEVAENLLGIPSNKIIGKRPEKVLPEGIAAELMDEKKEAGSKPSKEIAFFDKRGQNRSFILVSLAMMDSENRFAGNTVLIQDISQIKDLQKEVRRNERLAALGKMAAGVAHELRNPLSSIKGLAILLRNKVDNDMKGLETADILIAEVERLNRGIGELLEYARPDKLQLESVPIEDIAIQSMRLLASDVEEAGVRLSYDFGTTQPVKVDRDKIQQVFLNLILNSIQALDQGGKIKISTYSANGQTIFKIEDNGCGISEEMISKVFDPYFTTKNEGTGLGLAMSVKIVEAHNAKIEFSSKLDVGTTVCIVFDNSNHASI